MSLTQIDRCPPVVRNTLACAATYLYNLDAGTSREARQKILKAFGFDEIRDLAHGLASLEHSIVEEDTP